MGGLSTKYRVLTWNVLENRDYASRIGRIADFIRNLDVDVVLLQETNDRCSQQAVRAFSDVGYVLKLQPGDSDVGQVSGVGIAYNPHKFAELPNLNPLNVSYRAMSLDLVPLGKSLVNTKPRYVGSGDDHHCESPLDYGSSTITFISYHGYWGTFAQPERLRELRQIDRYAHTKGNTVILGGDFNALPGEPGVRYLIGESIIGNKSTYWVEAQELIQQLGGPKPYGTSYTHGRLIDSQPRFDLHHTPERRIDYLFNFGFSYGRRYAFDGWHYDFDDEMARSLSDHAPIIAGLLDD